MSVATEDNDRDSEISTLFEHMKSTSREDENWDLVMLEVLVNSIDMASLDDRVCKKRNLFSKYGLDNARCLTGAGDQTKHVAERENTAWLYYHKMQSANYNVGFALVAFISRI